MQVDAALGRLAELLQSESENEAEQQEIEVCHEQQATQAAHGILQLQAHAESLHLGIALMVGDHVANGSQHTA